MDKDKLSIINSINDVFDVEEESSLTQTTDEKNLIASSKADDDYEYSKEKLKSLIETGETAIEAYMDICSEMTEPRAYEVLATLLKNTGDLAKSVMDNAKTKASIDKDRGLISRDGKPLNDGVNQTNNIVFAGSTKDLMDMIKEQRQKAIDGVAESVDD